MADKRTIGLTNEGREIIAKIMEVAPFRDQMDVAKFAISVALGQEVSDPERVHADTTWNIGGFDNDGKLALVFNIIEPAETEPYRKAERLIDHGLKIIDDEIADKGANWFEEVIARQEKRDSRH